MAVGSKLVIATLVVVWLLGAVRACLPVHDPSPAGVSVRNNTSLPLTFKIVLDGQVLPVEQGVPAHDGRNVLTRDRLENGTLFTKDGCTMGDLVAFGPGGSEVARHPAPLCVGDNWVIDNVSPSSTSPTTGVPPNGAADPSAAPRTIAS
jgi:hypothetical protein